LGKSSWSELQRNAVLDPYPSPTRGRGEREARSLPSSPDREADSFLIDTGSRLRCIRDGYVAELLSGLRVGGLAGDGVGRDAGELLRRPLRHLGVSAWSAFG
jgi:hypothetical protein